MADYGDYNLSAVVRMKFTTTAFATAAPTTLSGTPAVKVYKTNSTTESTAGVSLTVDFDSVTGLNHVDIDTSSDGTFYAAGCDFQAVITAGTVGGTSVVGSVVGSFSILNRAALRPTTAGRTLDVSNGGEAGLDWGNVGSPTTTVGLSGTTVLASTSVTNAIVLPTIPSNWIAAAGIAASALNGKGDWNIGKTGYSLTQAFPTNFSSMSIDASGRLDLGKWIGVAPLALSSQQVQAIVPITQKVDLNTIKTNPVTSIGTTTFQAGNIATSDDVAQVFNDTESILDILPPSFPTNFSVLGIGAGGHISNVDTLTTYSGNTPQTGDSFARIGLAGAGLTNITLAGDLSATMKTSVATAAQAALTAQGLTTPRAAYLDNINVSFGNTILMATRWLGMAELSGSLYRYTVAAVANAPAGSGGGSNDTYAFGSDSYES